VSIQNLEGIALEGVA